MRKPRTPWHVYADSPVRVRTGAKFASATEAQAFIELLRRKWPDTDARVGFTLGTIKLRDIT